MKQMDKQTEPDWAEEARGDPYRPNWQDKIPHGLHGLGKVFFPIPPGRKGWSYPHHKPEKRYSATSETLNAYFECGWSYGISCAGSLAVVDIDEKELVEEIASMLPETVYQWSGSREGVHLFYKAPGLNKRQILKTEEGGETKHVGEIKCDPHGYVVGPGSLHPSGNHYGPLKGDSIAEIDKRYLTGLSHVFHVETEDSNGWEDFYEGDGEDREVTHQFYELDADEVLPWLEPNKRIEHPVHGSDTGMNFMKNDDRETFTCWRCQYGPGDGCGINPQQLLALMETGETMGDHCCERVRQLWSSRPELHYQAWTKALEMGLVTSLNIPYKVALGYASLHGIVEGEHLVGEEYHDVMEQLKYRVISEQHPLVK